MVNQSLDLAEQATQKPDATTPSVESTTSQRVDQIVQWFKWPSAVCMAMLWPLSLWGLGRLIALTVLSPRFSMVPFIAGVVGFTFLWRRWLHKSRWGSFLITLEHESTHAIFALLTWHSIVGFRASLGQGGEVRFAGTGNWLIIAAPYFFPTAAILLFLLAFFLPFAGLPWQSLLLGVALAYHLISTYRETHRDQSDLKDLGKLFCWLFLPAANLMVTGLLIAFSYSGSDGISTWYGFLREPVDALWKVVWVER